MIGGDPNPENSFYVIVQAEVSEGHAEVWTVWMTDFNGKVMSYGAETECKSKLEAVEWVRSRGGVLVNDSIADY